MHVDLPAPVAPALSGERLAYLTQMRVKLHQKLVERLNTMIMEEVERQQGAGPPER